MTKPVHQQINLPLTTPKMKFIVETETSTKTKIIVFEDAKHNKVGQKELLDQMEEHVQSSRCKEKQTVEKMLLGMKEQEKQAGENEPLLGRKEDPFKKLASNKEQKELVDLPFLHRLDIFLNYVIHFNASNKLATRIENKETWIIQLDGIKIMESFIYLFSSYDYFLRCLKDCEWTGYTRNIEEGYDGYEHNVNKTVKLVRPRNKHKPKDDNNVKNNHSKSKPNFDNYC
jgi:hypothetical protein